MRFYRTSVKDNLNVDEGEQITVVYCKVVKLLDTKMFAVMLLKVQTKMWTIEKIVLKVSFECRTVETLIKLD